MNADNDYQIGCNHIVCEDYSLSGANQEGTGAFIIVSDGCSASEDVDLGARLLSLSARELLIKLESGLVKKKNTPEYLEFGSQIIQRANVIPPLFPALAPGVLDATLLVGWVNNGILRVYMYGDGVFLRKTKDGTHAIHVSFSNNAPNYLSYLLDNNRKEGYLKMGGTKEIFTSVTNGKPAVEANETSFSQDPFSPVMFETDVASGDVIALCSDGINSYRTAGFTNIEWTDLIEEFIGYKNFDGAFVKRRMAAFKRKCLAEGITHYDDISIASMII